MARIELTTPSGVEKAPRVELITWKDAYNKEGRWRDVKSLKKLKPAIIKTVGFVVSEDDEGVVTASDFDSDPKEANVHGVSYIPKCMIVSRVPLGEAESQPDGCLGGYSHESP